MSVEHVQLQIVEGEGVRRATTTSFGSTKTLIRWFQSRNDSERINKKKEGEI